MTHIMIELHRYPEVLNRILGMTTLQVSREVLRLNTDISHVHFQAYSYVPNKASRPDENIFKVNRNEFLIKDVVESIIEPFSEDYNLALNSNVVTNSGRRMHFQMMDLAPRKSKEGLDLVVNRLNKIIVPRFGRGFLIETNKSYQYLGLNLLTEEEWVDFLGLNLVTSVVRQVDEELPRVHEFVSDYRYIGWSLLRRFAGLRVTTRGTKKFNPRVIMMV